MAHSTLSAIACAGVLLLCVALAEAQIATSVDGEVIVTPTSPPPPPSPSGASARVITTDGEAVEPSAQYAAGLLPSETYFRVETEERPHDAPFFHLPASTARTSGITCYGEHVDWRSCEFTNMCFNHEKQHYEVFVLASEYNKWRNLPKPCVFTESSVDGIFVAHVEVNKGTFPVNESTPRVTDDAPSDRPSKRADTLYEPNYTLMARIHQDTYNMYHTIHDDILPLFHLASFYKPIAEQFYGSAYNHTGHMPAIDRRVRIAHSDWTTPLTTQNILLLHTLFSDYPARAGGRNPASSWHHFGQKRTCYNKIVVGAAFNSRTLGPGWHATPAVYPHAHGIWMRLASDYILTELGLPRNVFESVPSTLTVENARVRDEAMTMLSPEQLIAFDHASLPLCSAASPCNVCYMQRTHSRRVLNEEELFARLRGQPMVENLYVIDELESLFLDMVRQVRHCDVLLGNHGAGLSLGVFMPRGATVVELVAFGVQQENFNYFGAMYDIPGSGINYVMVQNQDGMRSFRPTRGRAATRDKGVLGLPKNELIDCLEMPIMQKRYTWASKCLHYWKDFETELDLDVTIPAIFRTARRTNR